MLVEFRVKNFRSIKDEQVLSLVASKDKTLEANNTYETNIKAAPRILRSAVIYGANASGKSNLIKALQYMRAVVGESATVIQPGQAYRVQPFLLNEESAKEPTEFEVTFILNGARYQYGFSMTQKRFTSEHLLVYKSAKPQRWFSREYDSERGAETFEFGSGLKGTKSLWESATRPNSLFLSMGAQLNSEQLQPIFDWFNKDIVILNEESKLLPNKTIELLQQDESRKQIKGFLSSADISISDIKVVTKTEAGQSVHLNLSDGKPEVRTEKTEEVVHQVQFSHETDHGNATFDLKDESSGTRNLLFLSGPVLDIIKQGKTLVIDELDTSLHTLLVRELVQLFQDQEANKTGAQLIFSTHDTALLDATGLFRRDQIWFVEKGIDQSSSLIALSEFSPRKNEALEKGYLTGRYGGIPFLERSLGITN